MNFKYLQVLTKLDPDRYKPRFQVKGLRGIERYGEDFEYFIELLTEKRLLESEYDKLLNGEANLTISIQHPNSKGGGEYRYINGIVHLIQESGVKGGVWLYHVTIHSILAKLKHGKFCRVFRSSSNRTMTVVKQILDEMNIYNFCDEIGNKGPIRNYLVQYQETNYDFIRRILKMSGQTLKIEHNKNGHLIIFIDSKDTKEDDQLPMESVIPSDKILSICPKQRYQPVDYCHSIEEDWMKASTIQVKRKSSYKHSSEKLGSFYQSGIYSNRTNAQEEINREIESIENLAFTHSGVSSRRDFYVGGSFQIPKFVLPELKESMRIVELEIEADQKSYRNNFVIQKSSVALPLPTNQPASPKIPGIQTATVVGLKNRSNIHVDDTCVVRILFHWDQQIQKRGENYYSTEAKWTNPSCGHDRGFLFTPKINEEVSITFENGYPGGKVVITGVVYNGINRQPFKPMEYEKRSIIKPDGTADSNELMLDDDSSNEKFEITAKKDMKINVGNNLEIVTAKDILLQADTLEMTANGTFVTGNIVTMSGLTDTRIAQQKATKMCVGISADLTAGGIAESAGGIYANVAIGSVQQNSSKETIIKAPLILNGSAGEIKQKSGKKIENNSLSVFNTASDSIENSAQRVIYKANVGMLEKAESEFSITKDYKESSMVIKETGNKLINENE